MIYFTLVISLCLAIVSLITAIPGLKCADGKCRKKAFFSISASITILLIALILVPMLYLLEILK